MSSIAGTSAAGSAGAGAARIRLDLGAMSPGEIITLQRQLAARVDALKAEIEAQHHPRFIERVGLDCLMALPVVTAESLGLSVSRKYPECVVTPEMLGGESVVRGLDGINRPFVAIKVNLLDSTTRERVAQVVEVVFKRYPYTGEGANGLYHGDNYVTALTNRGDDGKQYLSGLYSAGSMSNKQLASVGKLLSGEIVEHQFDSRFVMQKV
jgi:hypothetical protein